MFSYKTIIFFIAVFARDLCGSLANPHNVSDATRLGKNCFDTIQAKLDRIGEEVANHHKIWNAIVLPSFQQKVNWEEAQLSVLKKTIEEKIERLENQQDAILKNEDCSPVKWFVPDNFQRIGSRLFYISTKVTLNWFSATNACRLMGGRLATIQNEEELQLIVRKLKWDSHYWLDLNDLSEEGKFVSSTSGKPAAFLNWRKGQPDNYKGNQHCVQLINRYIYDSSCNEKQRFICEA